MKLGRICALTALYLGAAATAWGGNVELSLNLRYHNPIDPGDGGTWNLVALSDDPFGLASVRAILANVDADPGDVTLGPSIGAVDPVDLGGGPRPAVASVGGVLDLAYGQDLMGSVVTGVGAGASAPGDVGRDVLTNSAWSHASLLASGTFPGGGNAASQFNRPQFTTVTTGEGLVSTSARVLTSGSAPFSAAPAMNVSTVVRGDSVSYDGLPHADNNRDWRVDLDDLDNWFNHFFTEGGWDQGDIDNDGHVGTSDKVWTSMGRESPPPANTAPRPHAVGGPNLSLQLQVERVFDENYVELPAPPAPGVTRVYEVVASFEIDGLDASEMGFGSISFDINLDGLAEGGAGGWTPNTATVDSNGSASGGIVPLYSTNSELGPSFTDLKDIAAMVAKEISNPVDPRVTVGQNSPAELGRLYVSWNGLGTASMTLDDVLFSALGTDHRYSLAYEGEDAVLHFGGFPPDFHADFNGDLVVDGADLELWKSGFGATDFETDGDADGDGDVDGTDFLAWQRQLGSEFGGAAAASVPEPSAWALGLIFFSTLTRPSFHRRRIAREKCQRDLL